MKSLLHYNTFGINQYCEEIYEPSTVEELRELLPEIRKKPLLVLGGGSNLLLTRDFPGNVLHPCMKGIDPTLSPDRSVTVRCGAGETWDDVVAWSIDHGYSGMENLSLIPGEVGASAVQNIGAYGVEVKDFITSIEAVETETGNRIEILPDACAYAYRYSRFKDQWKGKYIITHVTYRLSTQFLPKLEYGNIRAVLGQREDITPADVRRAIIQIRQAKLPDPKVEGNAGSFFMNPIVPMKKFQDLQRQYPDMPHYPIDADHEKIPAGWMIEQCGWKGKSLGRAGVHHQQALVLVNRGGATGEEIVNLCHTICQDVYNRFGIRISPEVNII